MFISREENSGKYHDLKRVNKLFEYSELQELWNDSNKLKFHAHIIWQQIKFRERLLQFCPEPSA
jgi:hypothetical protein